MENSLDNLLAPSLRSSIELNLGKDTLNKIEQRLAERHGLSLVQAIKDFYIFDSVLREFFGAGADGLEQKFLSNIIDVKTSNSEKSGWIEIRDPSLSKIFLESFADSDKKSILVSVMEDPMIISNILERCKIPQTSGYRKINTLINYGMLISNGHELSRDGKKIKKYETVFTNIKMDVVKNSIMVKVQMKQNSLSESSVIKIIAR
jgi:hypothetical protein